MDEAVRGLAPIGLDRLVDVAARLVGIGARRPPAARLERRREEQGLATERGLGDDPVDGGLEAHVEHPVGLVDDQHPDAVEGECAAVEQVLEPPGVATTIWARAALLACLAIPTPP